ncbi:hypothetical protein Dda_4553 [Drechslerella dactyloides]|uniref:Uncharacterized protein n=1 Tax=Drechslerella dactyloides TaxID=74499 RepID=A0AAD6IX52_DREDA|nr:hypothetical protein Dda_4553 [Drechslerella dactyloides]
MGSIELQIAHGRTPIPFMLPLKKAKDPECFWKRFHTPSSWELTERAMTLRSIIRTRTGCAEDTKITMYNQALKVIHWDDWEDIIEADGYYIADLNDQWVKHLIARGTAGSSTTQVQGFLSALTDNSQSSGAPANPRLPTGSSVAKQVPPAAPVAAASKPTKESPAAPAPVPATPKVRFAQDTVIEGTKVSESVVKELQNKIAEMNVVYTKAKAKDKKAEAAPDANAPTGKKVIFQPQPQSKNIARAANNGYTFEELEAAEGIVQISLTLYFFGFTLTANALASRTTITAPRADVPFVASKEPYDVIEKKIIFGGYSVSEHGVAPYKTAPPRKAAPPHNVQVTHQAAPRAKAEKEASVATPDRAKTPKLENANKHFFKVLDPNPREIEDPAQRATYFVLSIPKTETPERFLHIMKRNPVNTRLMLVMPSRDFKSFEVLEYINPGSRLGSTSFKDLEWPAGSFICMEEATDVDPSEQNDSSLRNEDDEYEEEEAGN